MLEIKTIDPSLVAQIVRSYVGRTKIDAAELPDLIAAVHRSLAELGTPPAAPTFDPMAGTLLSVSTADGAARCSAAT